MRAERKPYYLNHEAGFQDFYAHLGWRIAPLEIAALLARYQSRSAAHGAGESVVMGGHDLVGLLRAEQIDSLSAVIDFRKNDQTTEITFCTFYLAPEAPSNLLKVNVNR